MLKDKSAAGFAATDDDDDNDDDDDDDSDVGEEDGCAPTAWFIKDKGENTAGKRRGETVLNDNAASGGSSTADSLEDARCNEVLVEACTGETTLTAATSTDGA